MDQQTLSLTRTIAFTLTPPPTLTLTLTLTLALTHHTVLHAKRHRAVELEALRHTRERDRLLSVAED